MHTRRQRGGDGEIEEAKFESKIIGDRTKGKEVYNFMEKLRKRNIDNLTKKIKKVETMHAELETKKTPMKEGSLDGMIKLQKEAFDNILGIYRNRIKFYKSIDPEIDIDEWNKVANMVGKAYVDFIEKFPGDSVDTRKLRSKIYNIIMAYVNDDNGLLESEEYLANIIAMGGAGTGKSTIANSIANLLFKFGIINVGNDDPEAYVNAVVIEPSDVIAGYVGQTKMLTYTKLYDSMESCMFFDEAYSFTVGQYGKEFIDALTDWTQKNKGMAIIIAAGYKNEMNIKFLGENPGMPRRFGTRLELKPYGLDTFLDRIERSFPEEKYAGNKILRENIIGLCILFISAIYPDVKNYDSVLTANQKFSERIKTYNILPAEVASGTECMYKSNLQEIYSEIMEKSNNINKRDILINYFFNKRGITFYNLLKNQQASIGKLLDKIRLHSIIGYNSLDELENDKQIDILEIMNGIFKDFLESSTDNEASVDIYLSDSNSYMIDIIMPSSADKTEFNNEIHTIVETFRKDPSLEYSRAIEYFYLLNEKYLKDLTNKDLSPSSITKLPESVDMNFVTSEYNTLMRKREKHDSKSSVYTPEENLQYVNITKGPEVTVGRKAKSITLKKR